MSFSELFQPGLRHLREERERQRIWVAIPAHGAGPPLGIDLDAGTARFALARPENETQPENQTAPESQIRPEKQTAAAADDAAGKSAPDDASAEDRGGPAEPLP